MLVAHKLDVSQQCHAIKKKVRMYEQDESLQNTMRRFLFISPCQGLSQSSVQLVGTHVKKDAG